MRLAPEIGLALATGALLGCAEPEPLTQLVVSIDTDVAVPDELFAIGYRVERGGGARDGGTVVGDFETFVDGAHRGARGLPLSFTVVSSRPGAIDVVVFGRLRDTPDGEHHLERRVRVAPVEGQARLLCLRLDRACIDATCDAEHTCYGGVCVEPQEDAATFPEITRRDGVSCP